jgi:primosomal protein N' (replication factor Y)
MFAFFELPTRKEFHYPPYATLIRMIIRGEVETAVQQYADLATERLRTALETFPGEQRLLGPVPCSFAKLRGKFRYHLLATATDGSSLRQVFREVLSQLPASDDVQWVVDVDPVDLL